MTEADVDAKKIGKNLIGREMQPFLISFSLMKKKRKCVYANNQSIRVLSCPPGASRALAEIWAVTRSWHVHYNSFVTDYNGLLPLYEVIDIGKWLLLLLLREIYSERQK